MAEKKIHGVALAGAGMVSDAHAGAIAEFPGTELRVVYSRTRARAEKLAARHGVPWTTDYAELLAFPGVDIVDITTPPWLHEEMAVAASKAGKHLVVEKPMAISAAGCRRMIEVCRENGTRMTVTFQNRHKKLMRRIKEYCDAGGLGRLIYGSAHVKWYRPQSYYDGDDWRGRRALEGGGVIFGQAGHYLDLLLWIMGPLGKVCTNLAIVPVHERIEIENLGVVTMVFRNGALGTLEAATSLYPGLPERLEIHGTRGTIAVEGSRLKTWEVISPGPGDEPGDIEEPVGTGARDPMAFPVSWHKACIADLCRAIEEGRDPWLDGREAMKLNEAAEMIYRSAAENRPVASGDRDNDNARDNETAPEKAG